MANISAFSQKLMLDWILTGQTATRPTTWGIGLSLGSPTSTSGSEWTGSGCTRQSPAATVFGSAAAAGSPVFNTVAITFGTFASAASVSGIQIWDTISGTTANAGNMLWYGLLAAPRTVASGDSIVIATSALTVSLA